MANASSRNPEWLVSKILATDAHSGKWANELCLLISDGADANVLRPLLDSGEQQAVIAAAFVMSEAASQSSSLLTYALPLSRHGSKRVRAYVVDFIAQQGRSLPADVREAADLLMKDSEVEVRDYAIQQFEGAGITEV